MLFSYLTSAIALGFIVALPPGSVTIISCQRALQNGFKNSLNFIIGSSISDIFYASLVYFGVANIISNNRYFMIILRIICGILLITLGITSLISIKNNLKIQKDNKFQSGFFSTLISGILITLTNPMTIIAWIAVAGNFFLIWNDKYPSSRNYGIVTIFFIMTGVMLWFVPLLFIVSRFKKIISEKVKTLLMIISNACLIVFGLIAFYYAYRSIIS
jgi:threonine/homoserine/homoserine lactone efflux protein